MTRDEFGRLEQHMRIRYIGTDEDIKAACLRENKQALKKGVVVSFISDYTAYGIEEEKEAREQLAKGKASWSYSWQKPDPDRYVRQRERGITMRTWGNNFDKIVPEDWEIADAVRKDLHQQRRVRKVTYARRNVKKVLDDFGNALTQLQDKKKEVDRHLEDIPLEKKFKILTQLTEEQKMWLNFLEETPEDIKKMIKEHFDK